MVMQPLHPRAWYRPPPASLRSSVYIGMGAGSVTPAGGTNFLPRVGVL